MTERIDAIIIGTGHNGLVCGTYLARAGLNVLFLEARDAVGGMTSASAIDDDYHVPGLAHTAFPLSPKIRKDLQLDKFGYSVGKAIDTIALDENGKHVRIGQRSVSGPGLADSDVSAYVQFKNEYLDYARALRPLFENRPPRLKDMDLADKWTLAKLGWNIRVGLGRESMNEFLRVAAMNMYDALEDVFDDERLKGALAADAVLGHHMGPRSPGTVLTWLTRLYGELNGPLSVVCGGRSQLGHALLQAAEASGASVRLGAKVKRILVEKGKAFGVETEDGEVVKAKIIVSNADPRSTFLDLVGAPNLDAMFAQRVSQIRGAGDVAKLHIALSGKPEFRGISEADIDNRLLISPTAKYVEHAFNHAKYSECSADPILEITVPSLHNDALAPSGHHIMSVNIMYVPYDMAGGRHAQKAAFAYKIIAQIGRYAPELKSLVVNYELLTPKDIERQYHVRQGHWHHGEMTIHQSFMMRPVHGAAQYDSPVDGLYLCGAGTHPGGGLTGLPGCNAAKRVLATGSTR
jgi:phytoene dehydrogenase-like protein